MDLTLHPWNRGFDWEPAAPGALPEAWRESWNEGGYFLHPDAFDAEVSAYLETRPDKKLYVAEAGNLTFSLHPVLRSARARAFCAHPLFAELAHALVGPKVRLYWDQAVYKKPERPGTLPWHQDNGYTYVEPQQYLTCWVALNDATAENGCPWVAPGLHRHGTLAHRFTPTGWECFAEDPPGALPVEAPAGSIVVFSSLTPHKTGPNTSDAVRKAYIVQIAPDGAVALHEGLPPEPLDHPERQFRIGDGAPGAHDGA